MIKTLMAFSMLLTIYNPYMKYIEKYSTRYNLNPKIVHYLCVRENSRFDPKIVNKYNAVGITQVRPIAFREWLRVEKKISNWYCTNAYSDKKIIKALKKPRVNIRIGCFYLRHMLNKNNYNYVIALTKYNQGCTVKKYDYSYANEILMNALR